jgi:hypothetical protein
MCTQEAEALTIIDISDDIDIANSPLFHPAPRWRYEEFRKWRVRLGAAHRGSSSLLNGTYGKQVAGYGEKLAPRKPSFADTRMQRQLFVEVNRKQPGAAARIARDSRATLTYHPAGQIGTHKRASNQCLPARVLANDTLQTKHDREFFPNH